MTEAELLAAIDADPEADAPRLAHADWLERNGDPQHAEFIRLQVRSGAFIWTGRSEHARESQLLSANRERWLGGRPRHANLRWRFVRGYPEEVAFHSLAAFRATWREAFAFPVRHVEFYHVTDYSRLASEPGMEQIRSVKLGYTSTNNGLFAVLRSGRLARLERLAIDAPRVGEEFLRELAGQPALARLRSLSLSLSGAQGIKEEAMAALATSPHLAGLRELELADWAVGRAARALWMPDSFPSLASLSLYRAPLWIAGIGGGGLPRLERLRVSHASLGNEGAAALAGNTHWRPLQLVLSYCAIRDAGAVALAGSPLLGRVKRLGLYHNRISDEGAVALAGSPHLRSLRGLSLANNLVGDVGALALGRSGCLPALEGLFLDGNPASPALREAVVSRFRTGGPPVEEAPAAAPAPPAPSAPVVGEADEDGLVRAILADPWDELARSVYADWLEEHGSPLHAALLRAPAVGRDKPWDKLEGGFSEGNPCQGVPALTAEGLPGVQVPVRSLRSKGFAREGPAWLRRHHIAEVQVGGTPGDWSAFFGLEALAQVRGLSLRASNANAEALRALAASPHVAGLASLRVGDLRWYAEGYLVALFSQPGLKSLCRLDMGQTPLTSKDLQALAAAECAPHLRHLALRVAFEDLDAASGPARAPSLDGLVTLNLSRPSFSEAYIKALFGSPRLPSLRNLLLVGRCYETTYDALAASPLLPRLRRLRVRFSRPDAAGVARLARAVAETPACRLVLELGRADGGQADGLVAEFPGRVIAE